MLRRLFALACVLAACKAWAATTQHAARAGLTPGAITIARQRFDALVHASEAVAFAERAAFVNGAVNQLVDYTLDDGADLWLTPFETLALGRGDCEDFAITKYFLLLATGAEPGELRLLYARQHDADARAGRPHMVLLARHPFVDPLVFDNLVPQALPISVRHDLEPVFSFDQQRLWVGAGERRHGEADRLRPWRDVLARRAAQAA